MDLSPGSTMSPEIAEAGEILCCMLNLSFYPGTLSHSAPYTIVRVNGVNRPHDGSSPARRFLRSGVPGFVQSRPGARAGRRTKISARHGRASRAVSGGPACRLPGLRLHRLASGSLAAFPAARPGIDLRPGRPGPGHLFG